MSYEIPNFYVGVLPADVNMSALGFVAVAVALASNTLGAGYGGAALVLPALGAKIVGIVQNNPSLGEPGQVLVSGVSKAVAGGVFAIGDKLMVDASGHFVLATTGHDAVAIALETGSANAVVAVLLKDLGLI